MERTEYNRYSRARAAETLKGASRHATPCNAGRAGAHLPSEALHPTRSSHALPRIARERVPTVPHVAKTRGNAQRQSARERVPTVARERVLTMREERFVRGACLSYHPVSVSGAKPRRTVFSVTTRGNMQLRR
jgi:hypothetical protein